MKRTICMLLAVLLCLSLLPAAASAAQGDIPIDEAHIPDLRFRDWLKTQSYGAVCFRKRFVLV